MPSGSLSAVGCTTSTSKSWRICTRNCHGGVIRRACGSNPESIGSAVTTATFALLAREAETIARAMSYSRNASSPGFSQGSASLRSVGPVTTSPSVTVRPRPSTAIAAMPFTRAASSASE